MWIKSYTIPVPKLPSELVSMTPNNRGTSAAGTPMMSSNLSCKKILWHPSGMFPARWSTQLYNVWLFVVLPSCIFCRARNSRSSSKPKVPLPFTSNLWNKASASSIDMSPPPETIITHFETIEPKRLVKHRCLVAETAIYNNCNCAPMNNWQTATKTPPASCQDPTTLTRNQPVKPLQQRSDVARDLAIELPRQKWTNVLTSAIETKICK